MTILKLKSRGDRKIDSSPCRRSLIVGEDLRNNESGIAFALVREYQMITGPAGSSLCRACGQRRDHNPVHLTAVEVSRAAWGGYRNVAKRAGCLSCLYREVVPHERETSFSGVPGVAPASLAICTPPCRSGRRQRARSSAAKCRTRLVMIKIERRCREVQSEHSRWPPQ